MPITQNPYELEAIDVPLTEDGVYDVGGVGEGGVFYPERLVVRLTEDVTGLLPVCVVSVGTNAPSYNDIISASNIGAVTAPACRTFEPVVVAGSVPGVVGHAEIKVKVDYHSGTGGKANVSLIGFLGP